MDFIFEALDAYEDAKKGPNWKGPRHDVRLPILAGASAGGMTAAFRLACFPRSPHVWPGEPKLSKAQTGCIRAASHIKIEELLKTTDLKGKRQENLVVGTLEI